MPTHLRLAQLMAEAREQQVVERDDDPDDDVDVRQRPEPAVDGDLAVVDLFLHGREAAYRHHGVDREEHAGRQRGDPSKPYRLGNVARNGDGGRRCQPNECSPAGPCASAAALKVEVALLVSRERIPQVNDCARVATNRGPSATHEVVQHRERMQWLAQRDCVRPTHGGS